MNSQKKLLKLFALVAILCSFFSCGNKLDRDKAKQLISHEFNFPSTVTEKLQHGEINYYSEILPYSDLSLAEQRLILRDMSREEKKEKN